DLARVGLEVVAQSGVLLEPPQRRLRKHNVRRALRPLRLELPNGLGPISGVVAVAALVVTREMPGRPAVEREERVVPVADDQHDAVLRNGLGDERPHACHEGVVTIAPERGPPPPPRWGPLERAVANPVPTEIVRVRPYLLLVDAREPPQVLLDVGAAVLAHLEVEGRMDDEPEARQSRTPRLVDDEARQQGGARAASDAHCPGSEGDLDACYGESVKGLCPASVGQDDQHLVLLEGLETGKQVQA